MGAVEADFFDRRVRHSPRTAQILRPRADAEHTSAVGDDLIAGHCCARVKVFHAGTAMSGNQIVTNGGRVLGVSAWAKDLRGARAVAYAAVEKIRFDGAHFRRDIAAKAL